MAVPLFLKNGHFVREIGTSTWHDEHRDDASGGFLWGFSGCHRYEAVVRLGLPTVRCRVRRVTAAVAEAVALAAVEEGLAPGVTTAEAARARLEHCSWRAEYRAVRAI
jgi:hypothetical protein